MTFAPNEKYNTGRPDTPVGLTQSDNASLPDKSVGPTDGYESLATTGSYEPTDQRAAVESSLNKRRHHLPHWQQGGSVYFITFRSARGQLPTEARSEVIKTIEFDDGRRYDLYIAVVMPDHVHMLIQPREKMPGTWYDLAAILKAVKGVSARRVNQLMGTEGTVWQQESFDRIVRDDREFLEKWNYMLNNPIKSGLAESQEDYEHIITGRPDTLVGR